MRLVPTLTEPRVLEPCDVDIAVLLERDRARDTEAQLRLLSTLQEVCGRDDVDLAVLNTAGPILKDRVVRQGRLVYARSERDRELFEAAAIKELFDFEHFSRPYNEALFGHLAEGGFLGH